MADVSGNIQAALGAAQSISEALTQKQRMRWQMALEKAKMQREQQRLGEERQFKKYLQEQQQQAIAKRMEEQQKQYGMRQRQREFMNAFMEAKQSGADYDTELAETAAQEPTLANIGAFMESIEYPEAEGRAGIAGGISGDISPEKYEQWRILQKKLSGQKLMPEESKIYREMTGIYEPKEKMSFGEFMQSIAMGKGEGETMDPQRLFQQYLEYTQGKPQPYEYTEEELQRMRTGEPPEYMAPYEIYGEPSEELKQKRERIDKLLKGLK